MKANKQPIIAEFKGKDGSLGYKKGKVYILKVCITSNTVRIEETPSRQHSVCIYDSVQNFLKNWNIIQDKHKWNDEAINPKKAGEYLCLVKRTHKKDYEYIVLYFGTDKKWVVNENCEHLLWTNLIPSPF